jgi:PTH1 family peptidyl-tRNA hydrolase
MKLYIGLGNPGTEYALTRHNVGFMCIDQLAKELGTTFSRDKYTDSEVAKDKDLLFAKPQTFMNSSGVAAKKLTEHYHIDVPTGMFLIHDDLDIKLGEYKIQFEVGPKVHNGVNSVEEELGTTAFWRLRIGVDNRDLANRMPGEAYVLQKFLKEELLVLSKVFSDISREI